MTLTPEEKQKLNPGLSAVMSFLFNGLGQIYNGQIKKGVAIMSGSAVGMVLVLMGAVFIGHWLFQLPICSLCFAAGSKLLWGLILFAVGIITTALLGFYSINDAYAFARKKLLE